MVHRDEARDDIEALEQKVRVILANSTHLERLVTEEFHRYRRVKLHQEENVVNVNAGGMSATFVEPSMTFTSAVDLVCKILDRIDLPYDADTVQGWVASACSTFAYARQEADHITAERLRFILDWVLKCLADSWLRRHPERYFRRQFLKGFRHPTSLVESGLQLSGPVAHGIFGTIWLHAKTKRVAEGKNTPNTIVRKSQRASPSSGPSGGGGGAEASVEVTNDLPQFAIGSPRPDRMGRQDSNNNKLAKLVSACPARGHFVVISVSKSLCKLPPEILSNLIHQMIEMETLPHVLPLLDAYEDLEHIHLVFLPIANHSIALIDHIFDLMHQNTADRDSYVFCEHSVQGIVWRLMSTLKHAHGRGLVHGCLRMGGCFLDDPESIDSLRMLEFGLFQLFHVPPSTPPMSIITPLELDQNDPVPPYRRDFQCIAEITYLLLGGQPLWSPESSLEFKRQRFKSGVASFVDKAYFRTTESAKGFVLELLKPAIFQKNSKIRPCHLATVHMTHRWFFPPPESARELDEAYDMIVIRRYDNWRNTLRLQTNLVKLLADRISLNSLERLCHDLQQDAEDGKIPWVRLQHDLQNRCSVPVDLLRKVNKAYGENTQTASIEIADFQEIATAWRQKRVRECLWQAFSRSKCLNGTMSRESCLDGLTSGVLHVWSRPARVLDIIFPLESNAEGGDHTGTLLGDKEQVSFLDLVAKSDAAGTLSMQFPPST